MLLHRCFCRLQGPSQALLRPPAGCWSVRTVKAQAAAPTDRKTTEKEIFNPWFLAKKEEEITQRMLPKSDNPWSPLITGFKVS